MFLLPFICYVLLFTYDCSYYLYNFCLHVIAPEEQRDFTINTGADFHQRALCFDDQDGLHIILFRYRQEILKCCSYLSLSFWMYACVIDFHYYIGLQFVTILGLYV